MSGQTKFLHIADIHAPYITRKVRSEYAPWLTDTIKRDMYHRDVLNKKSHKDCMGQNMRIKHSKEREII